MHEGKTNLKGKEYALGGKKTELTRKEYAWEKANLNRNQYAQVKLKLNRKKYAWGLS